MTTPSRTATNVKQAVPFFAVSNIEESVRYRIEFESETDVPEETELSEQEA